MSQIELDYRSTYNRVSQSSIKPLILFTLQFSDDFKDIGTDKGSNTLLFDEDFIDISPEKEYQAKQRRKDIMLTQEQMKILEERKFQFLENGNPDRLWHPGTGPGNKYPLVPYYSFSGGKAINYFVEIIII